LLLSQSQQCTYAERRWVADGILNKIEDSDAIAHGREEMGSVWAEQEVAPTVNCSQEVGKLP